LKELSYEPLLQYIRNDCTIDYSVCTPDITDAIREIGVRNMFIQKKLHELMQKLEAEGITAVALKGSHLIHTVYPFGIRPLEDIDLLIPRKDFNRADQMISSMGYTDCAIGLDTWTHLQFSNKMTYTDNTLPFIPIDVHFSLGPYPYLGKIDEATLFENTELLVTPSGTYNVLQPEVLLLHLCLHLFQHRHENWQKSGCDIIALIHYHQNHDQSDVDWDQFVTTTLKNALTLPVLYSLNKASEIAAHQIVPITVKTTLESRKPNRYEQRIYNFSLREENTMEKHLLQFITTPGVVQKLQCIVRIIVPRSIFLKRNFSGSYIQYAASILKTVRNFIKVLFKKTTHLKKSSPK